MVNLRPTLSCFHGVILQQKQTNSKKSPDTRKSKNDVVMEVV